MNDLYKEIKQLLQLYYREYNPNTVKTASKRVYDVILQNMGEPIKMEPESWIEFLRGLLLKRNIDSIRTYDKRLWEKVKAAAAEEKYPVAWLLEYVTEHLGFSDTRHKFTRTITEIAKEEKIPIAIKNMRYRGKVYSSLYFLP